MKIDDVELTLFNWDNIPPTRYHAGSRNMGGQSNLGLLTIKTDAGLTGHAFLGGATNPAESDAGALIRFLKPVLMGQDPLARVELHAALRARQRTAGLRTVGACDTALWDIAAKAANLPLYKFLGAGRSSIGAYASSQILDGRQAYAGEAAEFKSNGWKAYKIHPPQDPAEDIKVCEAVRKSVGDDYTLMLDFDLELQISGRAQGRPRDRGDGLFCGSRTRSTRRTSTPTSSCARSSTIPILATEYPAGDIGTYAVWLTERATDYLRGDIPIKGGISTLIKTAHLAEAFHMNYEVHHGGNSHNNMAQLHFACSLRNTTFFEVLLPDGAHKYGVINDIKIDKNGMAHCPETPGIGAEIDFELIKKKQIAVLK